MNLEQLRAWLDSHGGYKDSIPTTQSRTKKTPAGDVTADEQVTVMVAADGSQLTVRGTGENTYEVVGEPKIATPAQAAAAAGGNTAPPGGKAFIDDGAEAGASGRRWGWNPETKAYDRDLGSSPSAQQSGVAASKRVPVPDKPGVYEVTGATKDAQGNSITETHYEDEQGNRVPTPTKPGATGNTGSKRIPVAGKPGVFQVTNDVKDAQGNTTSETHFEDEAGNRVPTPGAEGTTGAQRTPVPEHPGIYQVTNATKDAQGNATTETHFEDEQGNRVATPTKPAATAAAGEARVQMVPDPNNPGQLIAKPIPGTDRAAPPDIGALKAELGNIVPELQDRWQKYLDYVQKSGGTYTMADAEKDITRDREMAQARANELTTQLNAQQNIRGQDITQRGQTLQDASSRQRFAETASTNAMNLVTKFPSIAARAGSGEGLTNVLQYLMNLQGEFGKTVGALPDTTPIGRAPGQEQVMGQGIGGPATNGPAPSVGPNGSSPIVFNINTASPAPDLSNMGSTMAAGVQPDAASQATPVGSPGSPSQLIDQWADPKDPRWNSTLEQIKAELPAPPGVTSQGLRESGMRVAGGQLRAPGAGAVGGGPVSNGAVGAVG